MVTPDLPRTGLMNVKLAKYAQVSDKDSPEENPSSERMDTEK